MYSFYRSPWLLTGRHSTTLIHNHTINTLKAFKLLLVPDHVMLAVQYLMMTGYDNMMRHNPLLLVVWYVYLSQCTQTIGTNYCFKVQPFCEWRSYMDKLYHNTLMHSSIYTYHNNVIWLGSRQVSNPFSSFFLNI